MKIEIWSDFVCPFCYIGKTKFEQALEQFEHKDEVELTYRSFQLNPNAKGYGTTDIHEVIAKKYNMSYEQAKANNEQIGRTAAEVGLKFDFDNMKPNNTFIAHQLAKLAKKEGKEKQLTNRFFQAYFEQGADIGDLETLLTLCEEVGLDKEQARASLQGSDLKAEIQNDQQQAHNLGINSVPFFILDNQYSVSGAQSIKHFLMALQQAYKHE